MKVARYSMQGEAGYLADEVLLSPVGDELSGHGRMTAVWIDGRPDGDLQRRPGLTTV